MPVHKRNVVQSLQLKLIIITIVIVGFFTSLFILYGMQQTRRLMRVQSEAYGESLAEGVATACSDILHQGNYMDLRKVINSIGRAYDTINAIEIYVSDELVLKYSAIDSRSQANPNEMVHTKGTRYISPIKVSVAKETVVLGNVHVICSVDRYYEYYLRQINGSFVSGAGLLLIISAFLSLIFKIMIVKPLNVIEEGTEIVGFGNLSHLIRVKSNDEIGRLADSFNEMTVRLKESKEEIEAWNQTLESRVIERTKQLQEANEKLQETQYQLVQSGKMAAIGLIGAGVAHELNNPLCCIIGYIQIMLNKVRGNAVSVEDFSKFEKYLTCVEKESKRCEGIVSNLLQFSRKSKKVHEKVDLRDVIDATLTVMEYQIRKWQIEMHVEHCTETVCIAGNGDKLQQVFINMIANAHHAMPEGGSITAKTYMQQTEKELTEAVVSFTDTGCGIPQENIDKLFKSFFSTQRDMNNLGLGLSISQQIVKDHNGRMEVRSEVGVGTTFSIILPLWEEASKHAGKENFSY